MITTAQEQKFLSLIEEHKKIIYKVCYSYCRQTEDRNDLAQEIAIQLWKSFERYSIRSSRRQLSRLECGCRRCCDCSGDMGVPKISTRMASSPILQGFMNTLAGYNLNAATQSLRNLKDFEREERDDI